MDDRRGLLTGEVLGGDEENGRDAVIASGGRVLAAKVFLPLPKTIRGGDVVGREKGEEELGGANALAQPPPEVLAFDDGFLVEESAPRAAWFRLNTGRSKVPVP